MRNSTFNSSPRAAGFLWTALILLLLDGPWRCVTVAAAETTTTVQSLVLYEDAFVRAGRYSQRNYGTENLQIKNSASREIYQREAFMKFVTPANLPADTTKIVRATLRLFIEYIDGSGVAYLKAQHVSDNSWSEQTITYSNRPDADTVWDDSFLIHRWMGWVEVDVTSAFQSHINDHPDDAFLSLKLSEVSQDRHIRLSSKDTSNSPELILEIEETTEEATDAPTQAPSASPTTALPTGDPTAKPTEHPSVSPTQAPTMFPTQSPIQKPTTAPTTSPSHSPTRGPTSAPTQSPTMFPTQSPIQKLTTKPTTIPSDSPTRGPTSAPTRSPTTATPTGVGSSPTDLDSTEPTTTPTRSPTTFPTISPTVPPSISPTASPTSTPTISPTQSAPPSLSPTTVAPTTLAPTGAPTEYRRSESLFPNGDAFVIQRQPTQNLGYRSQLQVSFGDWGDAYSFVHFDLQSISGTLHDATVSLLVTETDTMDILLHPVLSEDWTEGSITWENHPPVDTSTILARVSVPDVGEWIHIDLTSTLNQVLMESTDRRFYTIAMLPVVEGSGSRIKVASWDRGDWRTTSPKLNVIYSPAYRPPSLASKFLTVLGECDLQAPVPAPAAAYPWQLRDGFSNWFLYLTEANTMKLAMAGAGKRSELRHKANWDSDSAPEKYVRARVRMPTPPADSGTRQVTFLQVHHKPELGEIDGPLLRVHYRDNGTLSANIRVSVDPKDVNTYKVLDVWPDNEWFDIEVRIFRQNDNTRMTLSINGEEKINHDLNYWTFHYNYFKAGAYIAASDGSTYVNEVEFDTLEISAPFESP